MKTIAEILTGREVLTLPGDASALDAAKAMREHNVGAVLVRTAPDAPLGIFTERDLMKRVVVPGLNPGEADLAGLMTREIFWTTPERKVNDMAREMQERHIRHLPVVENGRVMGLLSLRDLLRALVKDVQGEVRALTDYIQGEAPR